MRQSRRARHRCYRLDVSDEPDGHDVPDPSNDPSKPSTPASTAPGRVWWAWPLRFSAQIFVVIWIWKFYGCMQLADCSDHSAQDRLFVHAIVAVMAAFAIEVILLVNRVFEENL